MSVLTWVTERRVVYSKAHCTFLAFSFSLFNPGLRYTDRDGVFVFFATLMISRKRGTPRVTFLALTPASRMQNLRGDMPKTKSGLD